MGEASGVCLERLYIHEDFWAPFFRLGDLIRWMLCLNKIHPKSLLWNELRNSDSTNRLSYSRFQLAPPQTKRWRKNTNFGNTFDFGFLPMGIGARPYTSSFFFVWQGALPQRHGAISGLHTFLRLCPRTQWVELGFVVGLVLWSGWQENPNDWPKMGLNSTSHGFPSFLGFLGPVWSLDFKICKWSVLFGHWMSQEEVVGATTKAKSEVSSTSPVLTSPGCQWWF